MTCADFADRRDLETYLQGVRPDSPMRLGVLSNPMARQNRVLPIHQHLKRAVKDPADIIETRRAADLRRALVYLLFHRRVNVLAANGGDGTLHTVVNALWELLDDLERDHHIVVPPPHMLFLNGGTMNMVSRAMRTTGDAVRTVRWFLRRYEGARLTDLRMRRQPVMAVTRDATHGAAPDRPAVGFIFGSELVYNAMWMYEHFGAGYSGLARFMMHAAVGPRLQTRVWEEFSHLLNPPRSAVVVDGVPYAPYSVAVASTIDMTLLKGLVRTLHVPEGSPGFHAKLILETDKERLLAMIPDLMQERRHPRVLDVPSADELRVKGPFTIDGELFPTHHDAPQAQAVVRPSPRLLLAIHNDHGED